MGIKSFRQYLKETTLSRVYQHATDITRPIGIMTAFQSGRTERDNMDALAKLAGDIQSAGYGYFYLDGHYTHESGEPVDERSIFIVGNRGDDGNLKGQLRQWRERYGQESVLYRPMGQTTAYLLFANSEQSIGEFHPNRLGDYYSRLRSRPGTFVFEQALVGKNWIERWTEDVLRKRGIGA